jgi:hypothetical protein
MRCSRYCVGGITDRTNQHPMFPHRLHTTFLAAGLLLNTLGCSKKADPPPVPSLEGSWTENIFTYTEYDATNTVLRQTTTDMGQLWRGYYTTFTSTTQQNFTADGVPREIPGRAYTRAGNVLSFTTPTRYECTIKVLTATDLVLVTKVPTNVTGSYAMNEHSYTRR